MVHDDAPPARAAAGGAAQPPADVDPLLDRVLDYVAACERTFVYGTDPAVEVLVPREMGEKYVTKDGSRPTGAPRTRTSAAVT